MSRDATALPLDRLLGDMTGPTLAEGSEASWQPPR
jgi:hypothetical protein